MIILGLAKNSYGPATNWALHCVSHGVVPWLYSEYNSRTVSDGQPPLRVVLRTQGVLAGEIFSAQKKLVEYLLQSVPRL